MESEINEFTLKHRGQDPTFMQNNLKELTLTRFGASNSGPKWISKGWERNGLFSTTNSFTRTTRNTPGGSLHVTQIGH